LDDASVVAAHAQESVELEAAADSPLEIATFAQVLPVRLTAVGVDRFVEVPSPTSPADELLTPQQYRLFVAAEVMRHPFWLPFVMKVARVEAEYHVLVFDSATGDVRVVEEPSPSMLLVLLPQQYALTLVPDTGAEVVAHPCEMCTDTDSTMTLPK